MTDNVIVVGGGVIGLSIAWQAAEAGLAVTVVADQAAAPASYAAVGGLSFCLTDAVLAGDRSVTELSVTAREKFAGFIKALDERSGVSTLFRKQATLLTRRADEDSRVLDRVEKARAAIGLSSVRLTGAECRDREPHLSAEIYEGLLLEEHHQIDSKAFVDALALACVNAGVSIVDGHVSEILASDERASGVRLDTGVTMLADTVVIAAGAWSGSLGGVPPELRECVRPIAGQVVVLDLPSGAAQPSYDLRNARAYIVNRADRSVLIGSTSRDEGFDSTATAADVRYLLDEAASLWPPVSQGRWIRTMAGLRPMSADGLPIVGESSVAGIFVATGHFKNGIMFAAETAEAIVDMLFGRAFAPSFAAFSPDRLIEK